MIAKLLYTDNAGTNKAASSSTSLNTKRLDDDTENLAREFAYLYSTNSIVSYSFYRENNLVVLVFDDLPLKWLLFSELVVFSAAEFLPGACFDW